MVNTAEKIIPAVPLIETVTRSPFCKFGIIGEVMVCMKSAEGKVTEAMLTVPVKPRFDGLPEKVTFIVIEPDP